MSYAFDNMARIGNDSCNLDQNSIQNVNACNYTLQNYFSKDCHMTKTIGMATSQPCVFYSGVSNVGQSGCLVDVNSALLFGDVTQTSNPKSKLDLYPRPYTTVPFLGRGSVDPVLESQITQGEYITNRRSINKLSEQNYGKYLTTPLIPSMQSKMGNPNFCIEGHNGDGAWVRGGVPSRELTRDNGKSSGTC
jgi:hypothetical protein